MRDVADRIINASKWKIITVAIVVSIFTLVGLFLIVGALSTDITVVEPQHVEKITNPIDTTKINTTLTECQEVKINEEVLTIVLTNY